MSQPFLLITPLGRLDGRVARVLRDHAVTPWEVRTIADYPRTASALYGRRPLSAERARVQLAYEDVWRARVKDVSAELWLLDDAAFAAAWAIKPRLRVDWPAEITLFGSRQLLLRTFHLPDPDDVSREWSLLKKLDARKGEAPGDLSASEGFVFCEE